ncbi:hypothetical protein VT84_06235 [Gemmata sp. SH-PL17]|nr:hypothetical protein VT84_06235 [Gemmata sp. SH-PL17]
MVRGALRVVHHEAGVCGQRVHVSARVRSGSRRADAPKSALCPDYERSADPFEVGVRADTMSFADQSKRARATFRSSAVTNELFC